MAKPKMTGKVVVVRSGQSGVHVGKLKHVDGNRAWLEGAQRLWSWTVAKMTGTVATCSEIAKYGIDKTKSKVAAKLDLFEVGGVDEIIPATKEAQKTWA